MRLLREDFVSIGEETRLRRRLDQAAANAGYGLEIVPLGGRSGYYRLHVTQAGETVISRQCPDYVDALIRADSALWLEGIIE